MIKRFLATIDRLVHAVYRVAAATDVAATLMQQQIVVQSRIVEMQQRALDLQDAYNAAHAREAAENDQFRAEQRHHMQRCEERYQARLRGEDADADVVKH